MNLEINTGNKLSVFSIKYISQINNLLINEITKKRIALISKTSPLQEALYYEGTF